MPKTSDKRKRPAGADQGGRPMRNVVIVGGGTAGWMTATLLSKSFAPDELNITLIESSAIGTVGVGEATVPAIRDFLRAVGISETEVLRRCNATAKLGICFDGWHEEGRSFIHPFSFFGAPAGQVPFIQLWSRLAGEGQETDFFDYSFAIQMARQNKFVMPPKDPQSPLFQFDWALHFDASLFAELLREHAIARGVKRIDARIETVTTNAASGDVEALILEDGRKIGGDLYIDCSGFSGLLISGALGTPFVDFGDQLFCDRAVAAGCEHGQERALSLTPYTRATAMAAGWRWRIPLQHRVGNGYIYSSQHISDDEASSQLVAALEGPVIAEPRVIRFRPGHREKFWNGNVVAIGLAGGFLEPLESTSITLIQTGIERLIRLFPGREISHAATEEFNRLSTLEFERIRDFLVLHYWANGRTGQPFWDQCREVSISDHLRHKIAMFEGTGQVINYEMESFYEPSWQALFIGMGIAPKYHDRRADEFSVDELEKAFGKMREAMDAALRNIRDHSEFVASAVN